MIETELVRAMPFSPDYVQKLLAARRFQEADALCIEYISQHESGEGLSSAANDPLFVSAIHLLGTSKYLQGNLGKSIEYFKRAITLDPKHTDSAISLSVIYNDIGRYDDAKKIYEVANRSLHLKKEGSDLLLDRKFAIKHVEQGDLYFKFHRYDDALEEYSKASRLDPKELLIRIKMAKVYSKKGFTTRAVQELQSLVHQNSDYIEARVHLGLIYYSQGNIIDAQLEWEKALAISPNNAEIQVYLDMARHSTETTN